MFVAVWSAKGGAGTSVIAAALAVVLARREGGALAVDLAGDLPAVLGVPDPSAPGVAEWLAAGDEVAVDALARLEVDVGAGLALVARGEADMCEGRGDVLASVLASEARPVVVDCGTAPRGTSAQVAAAATSSLLVTRPCYLALRRAMASTLRPTGVVLVHEDGRALSRRDVESVLAVPVRAEVRVDPAVARAVDAGLLAGRLPRPLERALKAAA